MRAHSKSSVKLGAIVISIKDPTQALIWPLLWTVAVLAFPEPIVLSPVITPRFSFADCFFPWCAGKHLTSNSPGKEEILICSAASFLGVNIPTMMDFKQPASVSAELGRDGHTVSLGSWPRRLWRTAGVSSHQCLLSHIGIQGEKKKSVPLNIQFHIF